MSILIYRRSPSPSLIKSGIIVFKIEMPVGLLSRYVSVLIWLVPVPVPLQVWLWNWCRCLFDWCRCRCLLILKLGPVRCLFEWCRCQCWYCWYQNGLVLKLVLVAHHDSWDCRLYFETVAGACAGPCGGLNLKRVSCRCIFEWWLWLWAVLLLVLVPVPVLFWNWWWCLFEWC